MPQYLFVYHGGKMAETPQEAGKEAVAEGKARNNEALRKAAENGRRDRATHREHLQPRGTGTQVLKVELAENNVCL